MCQPFYFTLNHFFCSSLEVVDVFPGSKDNPTKGIGAHLLVEYLRWSEAFEDQITWDFKQKICDKEDGHGNLVLISNQTQILCHLV